MFPKGTVGAALFILRISAAATFVVEGTSHWTLVTSPWIFVGFAVPALCLCFGFLTPYCSALSCLMQMSVLVITRGQNEFHLVNSIVVGGVVAVLGPGAYSIDGRIFGRRLLTVPPRT
jgi:uncharacterized membrane protein YphA (DoxX/SURF4 family)